MSLFPLEGVAWTKVSDSLSECAVKWVKVEVDNFFG
jgi:hypothetical protein